MKKVMLGLAALSAAFIFTACDGSKEVVEKFLQATLDRDNVTMMKYTKGNHQGKTFTIKDKEKNGDEVIYIFDILKQDGSVDEANQVIVLFKDKNMGKWLVDEKRSAEEQDKRDKASKK